MSTPEGASTIVNPVVRKGQTVATDEFKRYQTLKKNLLAAGGPGAGLLKKYDISPYLKQQDAFFGQLTEFERLRIDYNKLSDQLRAAQVKPIPLPEVEKLEKDWLDVGGKMQKMGSKELKDVGGKFRKNLLDYDSKVEKLVGDLEKSQTKAEESEKGMTPKQRQQLVGLLNFLRTTRGSMRVMAKEDFDFVQGSIDKVKAATPIK
jgi:hypothetical protein